MRRCLLIAIGFGWMQVTGGSVLAEAPRKKPLEGVRRVVFLGDSITYAGQYIEFLETYLRVKEPGLECEFLDLGLPSETVSGLSEPGHAGGAFPRPDLHERIDRVLEKTRPGLIVACYGMNDGIYYPFGEDRLARYADGLMFLRERAAVAGIRVLHLTPPVFDPEPIRARTLPAGLAEYRQPFVGYDDVLARYSDWLVRRGKTGWDVVDVHGPMKAYLDGRRLVDKDFRLADDGVHANATGHWLITWAILRHWGYQDPLLQEGTADAEAALRRLPNGAEVLALVRSRQRLLKDAWLTATGHTRPGMSRGEPLERAQEQARAIEAKIRVLVRPK